MIAIENGKIVTLNGVITGKTLWLDNDCIAAIGACDSVLKRPSMPTAGTFCRA
ncbi:MAG: hypothetical protein ACLUOF_07730 [Ruminococcus sp.]